MMWSRTTGAPVRSGKRAGKTKISKKGNSRIRRILYLPAFNAVRFGEPACQALFERVFERSQIRMKAYVAVQKKLLTLCYAIWKNNASYDPEYNSARAAPQQCQRTRKQGQKNSPDRRDYSGCSSIKRLLLSGPKNIKKILFQNLYFKTVPASFIWHFRKLSQRRTVPIKFSIK